MSPAGPVSPASLAGPPRVVADLRSDTLTRPTPAMRAAMAGAEVGDDVYGEDPTVAALEARVAALLGHEAGLFCPTGSLTNVLGVASLVAPGTELLCDELAHVVRAELGAHAVTSGVTTRTWRAPRGLLDAAALERVADLVVADAGPYQVSTAAVAVEDTHNFGGGTVQPLASLRALRALADDAGIGVHLDGARVWNAAVATTPGASGTAAGEGTGDAVAIRLREIGSCADTVSVCLSKGLGAPIGSVLVASAERIARARVARKRAGAGMRQVGVLAAAGLHALDHHVARLADDHARARHLAAACAAALPGCVEADLVETNIVVLDVPGAPAAAAAALARGVAVSALGARTLRLVTHLDVDDAAADRAAGVLAQVLTGARHAA